MRLVDAHCHAALNWYEPVELLIAQMDLNDVEFAVLVQTNGMLDLDYQFAAVEKHSDRLVGVSAVRADSDDPASDLQRLKDRGAKGVRFSARGTTAADLELWQLSESLGLSISVRGDAVDFAATEFRDLAKQVTGIPITLEHLASNIAKDPKQLPDDVQERILQLASLPNVYVKFSGLGEIVDRMELIGEGSPFVDPAPPRLRAYYDAFGSDRMMWSSNHPLVSAAEGYANSLRYPLEYFSDIPEDDRAALFGDTAVKIYGFGE
ncbi:MAG: amidohydrolase family protein [Dehalococcoidia bacterium]